MEEGAVEIRWMRHGDMQDVLRIMDGVECGGDGKSLAPLLEKPSVMCVVAEVGERVVGFAIYDVARVSKLKILSLAVEKNARRKGVGSRLVGRVVAALNKKRNKAEVIVSEYNVPAQLFLRSVGFKAVSVVSSGSDFCDYKFAYKLSEMAKGEV